MSSKTNHDPSDGCYNGLSTTIIKYNNNNDHHHHYHRRYCTTATTTTDDVASNSTKKRRRRFDNTTTTISFVNDDDNSVQTIPSSHQLVSSITLVRLSFIHTTNNNNQIDRKQTTTTTTTTKKQQQQQQQQQEVDAVSRNNNNNNTNHNFYCRIQSGNQPPKCTNRLVRFQSYSIIRFLYLTIGSIVSILSILQQPKQHYNPPSVIIAVSSFPIIDTIQRIRSTTTTTIRYYYHPNFQYHQQQQKNFGYFVRRPVIQSRKSSSSSSSSSSSIRNGSSCSSNVNNDSNNSIVENSIVSSSSVVPKPTTSSTIATDATTIPNTKQLQQLPYTNGYRNGRQSSNSATMNNNNNSNTKQEHRTGVKASGNTQPEQQPKHQLYHQVPKHIGIVMDGNTRWSTKHHVPTIVGHTVGANRLLNDVLPTLQAVDGIKYCTVYGFSTENWNRSHREITDLMNVMERTAQQLYRTIVRQNQYPYLCIRILGNIHDTRIPLTLRTTLQELETITTERTHQQQILDPTFQILTVSLAINYGGRQDILQACQQLMNDRIMKHANNNNNNSDEIIEPITEQELSSYLYTRDLPDPDLIIRSSGEYRLSNFLLWNVAYAELYITDVLWPDFTASTIHDALTWYSTRTRRFGSHPSELNT